MTHYPGGCMIPLHDAQEVELKELLERWTNGTIKWVKLTTEKWHESKEHYLVTQGNGDDDNTDDGATTNPISGQGSTMNNNDASWYVDLFYAYFPT
jgi:hypothetical protein